MRAAVLSDFGGEIVVRDVAEPRPGIGEVLVEVVACGVGLTLERARTGSFGGTTPRVVGHELSGTVIDVGDGVTGWSPGDRVTTSFYVTCGRCRMCASGRETLCDNFGGFVGVHVDGGLAERVALPARILVAVPDDLDLAVAGVVADAVATPYHVATLRAPIHAGQRVAVIGAGGGVGVHMALTARAFGASVVAVEKDEQKLGLLEGLDFAEVVEARQGWCEGLLMRSGPVDICVDLVASPGTLRDGLAALAPAGVFVIVGYQGEVDWQVDPSWLLLGERSVVGSRYATRSEIAGALDLVASGRVQVQIGAEFDLDATPEAYRAMQANEVFGRLLVWCP